MSINIHRKTESTFCYGIIHDFFDLFGFRPAIKSAERIIFSASSEEYWYKEAPYHVVFFLEHLERMVRVVFEIETNVYHYGKAILFVPDKSMPDVRNRKNYVNPHQKGSDWEYFPRHLSAAQFFDPYKALKKFTKCYPEARWNKILKDLAEYALSKNSITGIHETADILIIRKHLLLLIEACHLLEVRTYIKPVS